MSALREQLADAEGRVAQLKRQIAQGPCIEVGHDWKHIGGRNAACPRGGDCICSVPVHECTKCGDCDYGVNDDADRTLIACDLRYDDETPTPHPPSGDHRSGESGERA